VSDPTTTDYVELRKHLDVKAGHLHKDVPAMKGFGQFHAAALGEGVIGKKTKELICIAIGITSRCQGCIAYHVRGAIKAGATKEEICDAIGVAMFMGGGPAMIYATEAHEALEQHWKAEKE
jgi:AhpD family alkylhydroperoxidase